jgi:hypothetical protein
MLPAPGDAHVSVSTVHPLPPAPLVKMSPSLTKLQKLKGTTSVFQALLKTVALVLSTHFVPLLLHRWGWFCTGSMQYTSNLHCLPSATFRNLGYRSALFFSNDDSSLQFGSAATPHTRSAAAGCRLADVTKGSAKGNTGMRPGGDLAFQGHLRSFRATDPQGVIRLLPFKAHWVCLFMHWCCSCICSRTIRASRSLSLCPDGACFMIFDYHSLLLSICFTVSLLIIPPSNNSVPSVCCGASSPSKWFLLADTEKVSQ